MLSTCQKGTNGFPLPSSSAEDFLSAFRFGTSADFARHFLRAALELSASDISSDTGKFCSAWSDNSQAMYDDFWCRVYQHALAALAVGGSESSASSAVVDGSKSTQSASGTLHSRAVAGGVGFPAARTPALSSTKPSSSASSSAAASGKSPFRVLIVFDEANILADTNTSIADAESPSGKMNAFRVLRRAIWALRATLDEHGALPIFMDTASQLSKFSPPLVKDDSDRGVANSSSDRISVLPPFSAIGSCPDEFAFDSSAGRDEKRESRVRSTSVLASSATLPRTRSAAPLGTSAAGKRASVPLAAPHGYSLLRGRPLWRAHFESKIAIYQALSQQVLKDYEVQAVWVELVEFAILKLCGGRGTDAVLCAEDDADNKLSVAASVGGCLLNLDIQPGSRLAARLVKSHMVRVMCMSDFTVC